MVTDKIISEEKYKKDKIESKDLCKEVLEVIKSSQPVCEYPK